MEEIAANETRPFMEGRSFSGAIVFLVGHLALWPSIDPCLGRASAVTHITGARCDLLPASGSSRPVAGGIPMPPLDPAAPLGQHPCLFVLNSCCKL